MTDSRGTGNRLAGRLVVSFALSWLLCFPAHPASALSVTPDFDFTLSVDPPRPKVGDTVRLTFTVALNGGRGGLPAYSLITDSTQIEGGENPAPDGGPFPDTVTFERRVVSAGNAQVQLSVNYEAGVENEHGQCCVWFFTYAQSPVFEFTVLEADDQNPNVARSCTGDCDGDGRVRVDELTRSVGIALGRLNGGACPSLPAVVTVDMLVAAVDGALHGCSDATPTPTPTPTTTLLRPIAPTATATRGIDVTESGIDLRPLDFTPARCLTGECLFVPLDTGSLCVGNGGDQNAGPFLVRVNDELDVLFEGMPSGVARCVQVPDSGATAVIVDIDDRIEESNEDNNAFAFPTLEPTACDVIVPPCTPTPTIPNVQSCDDCCDHCATEVCFLGCFGVQACQLITESEGTVTDETTGEPIAGAEVTVNGRSVRTDDEGVYSTTSVKNEVCNGLDYLYEISVRAPGYRGFLGQMYQSLVPGVRRQDVTLEPES